jgi:hypothetical protein
VEGIEALLPQGPVMTEPFVDLCQRLGTQAVHAKLRLPAHIDEASLTQHPQMPRHARASDREQRGQVTHDGRTVLESDQLAVLIDGVLTAARP